MTAITTQCIDALRYIMAGDQLTEGCKRRATEALAAYDAQQEGTAERPTRESFEGPPIGDHTPEPWQVEAGTLTISAPNFKGEHRARVPVCYPQDTMNREVNARRIVACVNACAGASSEFLESLALGELVGR